MSKPQVPTQASPKALHQTGMTSRALGEEMIKHGTATMRHPRKTPLRPSGNVVTFLRGRPGLLCQETRLDIGS
ncbi:hypothetical protein SAM23877_6471 [Streptomyces ambofaciens ATCC 23877]|uniref:Uncharacterized protein n=1 Tax=Streptomyces ambofaciens (strain ATCC 23877 / 3486 / DSM 40053 / JCM 4204 / NBRC 12836 / NRRL B-2516) TaxID=278992 RepID=A0A0K2B301_STRA7|nr:hypothetical protein SAM23877_6471 [Streptomyces ambofaciens ATCC 23877]